MKKKRLWFLYPVLALVLTFSLAVLAVPAVSVNADVMPFPHNFSGSVTIGTEPAPPETEIEASGVGVVPWEGYNPITTDVVGEYSGLRVKGYIDEGTPIEFYVDGMPAQVREHDSTGPWLDSYPWHSDGLTELDLAAPAIESVDVVPVTHVAGVEQVIEVTVTTSYVADDTVVTVSFVDELGEPLAPAITNTGAITDNSAIVNITVSDTVAAGDYQVKVEVAGIAEPDFTTYTITTPVSATIDPIEASYDLFVPGGVETTITWGDATSVVSVEDAVGALTTPDDYEVVGDALTIKDAYLAGELLAVGDSVVLTIAFDVGDPATFTITAIDTTVSATIDPEAANYDLFVPGNVETTITWNDATEVVSVTYGETTLTVATDYTVSEVALAIFQSYIEGIDPAVAVDDALGFTIAFDVGEDATFTVNVIDTTPVSATISPIEADYDLFVPGDIETTITWNDTTSVVSVEDAVGALTTPDDYEVVGDALTIKDAYLAGELLAVGDSVVLTIAFDVGDPATFTITAIDTTPVPGSATIDPIEADYDLFVPGDIETTITWNDATAVVSVEDAVGALTTPDDYEVVGDALTIKDAYLAGKLLAVGDSVVLTIAFDVGDSATFAITAIDTTPVYDVLLTLNDGWTLISTDKWIDADSSAWEGDVVLVYRYTSEGYLEATLADLEPVEALYVKMPGGGQARLTYSDVVPGVSTKELVAGWNLISSATDDDAAAVLSPLRYVQIGEQQVVGLTTLVSQASYNVSGVSLYLATLTDANWDTLADTSLNPFDGYWVYMNGAKSFGVIPE